MEAYIDFKVSQHTFDGDGTPFIRHMAVEVTV